LGNTVDTLQMPLDSNGTNTVSAISVQFTESGITLSVCLFICMV